MAEQQLTETKKSETELRLENAVCSKSTASDLMPIMMSLSASINQLSATNTQLSATNAQQSSTIEQLLKEISNLKQNEKLLKKQLVNND